MFTTSQFSRDRWVFSCSRTLSIRLAYGCRSVSPRRSAGGPASVSLVLAGKIAKEDADNALATQTTSIS